MRHLCVLLLCFVVAHAGSTAYTQSVKPTQSSDHAVKGSISGHVFAVTNAGDLKPARFAKVYVISGAGNKNHQSAVMAYFHRSQELVDARSKKLQQDLNSGDVARMPTEEANCETDLLNVNESVAAAV